MEENKKGQEVQNMKLTDEQLNQVSGGTGSSNRYRIAYSTLMQLEDGTNYKLFKGTEVQLLGYQDVPMFGWRLAVIEYNGIRGALEPEALEAI